MVSQEELACNHRVVGLIPTSGCHMSILPPSCLLGCVSVHECVHVCEWQWLNEALVLWVISMTRKALYKFHLFTILLHAAFTCIQSFFFFFIDLNVIKKGKDKNVDEVQRMLLTSAWKEGGGILKTEGHDLILKMSWRLSSTYALVNTD